MQTVQAPPQEPQQQQPVASRPPAFPNDLSTLLQLLKRQVEYYFSPQNLANDQFLQGQLRATEHLGAIHIDLLCSFPKIRQLHTNTVYGPFVNANMVPPPDAHILRVALQNSTIVSISDDGYWISPVPQPPASSEPYPRDTKDTSATVATVATSNTTVASVPSSPSSQATVTSSIGAPVLPLPLKGRNTLVLVNVPADVEIVDIEKAFEIDGVAPMTAHHNANNRWHLEYEVEEHAVRALDSIDERKINGIVLEGHLMAEGQASNVNDQGIPQPPLMPLSPAHPDADAQQVYTQAQHASPYMNAPPQYHQGMMPPPPLPQQQYGYGVMPYPYYMATPHHLPFYPVPYPGHPQNYPPQYGYPQYPPQFRQRQPAYFAPSGRRAPPTNHVYVQPPMGNQQRTKKKNKRGVKNRGSSGKSSAVVREEEKSIEQIVVESKKQSSPQDDSGDRKKNDSQQSDERSNGQNGSRKSRNRRRHDKKKGSKAAAALNPEDFPVLGGSNVKVATQSRAETSDYAKAVLRNNAVKAENELSSESQRKEVEDRMAAMTVSDANNTST